MRFRPYVILVAVLILLSACTVTGGPLTTITPGPGGSGGTDNCPSEASVGGSVCYTPHSLRVAYGVESLTAQGYTGKGQTVIDIVSFGSPTLQQDMDTFDQTMGLPPITLKILSPLGTKPFDPNDPEMSGWQQETTLDVEIIHAIAPEANIVVLTSPVAETEGTIGLPQFLQLEQYAVQNHLGQIFSQSFTASEATLTDSAGQALVKQFTDFYQQIVTQDHDIVVNASGDSGATDCAQINCLDSNGNPDPSKFASTPTIGFPADVPWVTTAGGTTLNSASDESAWACNGNGSSCSGGGASQFFSEPSFQRGLPQSAQSSLGGQRGIPDVAADADPATGMAFYVAGQWAQTGGTSAAAPLWAGIFAVANQMAGHSLGFVNPGLYKVGESANAQKDYRDITNGDNTVQLPGGTVQGFQAGPGWDEVTGWGSPLASQLIPDLINALK